MFYVPRNALLTNDCQRNHPMNHPCNSHSLNNHFSFVVYVVVSAPNAPFPNPKKETKTTGDEDWGGNLRGEKQAGPTSQQKTSKDAINKKSWGKVGVRHVPWLNLRPRFVHNISINAASLGISFLFIHVILNCGFLGKHGDFECIFDMIFAGDFSIHHVFHREFAHRWRGQSNRQSSPREVFFCGYTSVELSRGIIQNDLINSDSS